MRSKRELSLLDVIYVIEERMISLVVLRLKEMCVYERLCHSAKNPDYDILVQDVNCDNFDGFEERIE